MQLTPFAKAVPIPSTVSSASYGTIGASIMLNTQQWFADSEVNLTHNLTVLTTLVTNNALVVVVKNTGNYNVTISGISILGANATNPLLQTQTKVETITTVVTLTQINTAGPTFGNVSAKDPKTPGIRYLARRSSRR